MQVAEVRGRTRAREVAHQTILEDFAKRFEEGNSTFAWLAYDLCARASISIPKWVNDYLAQSAAEILKLLKRPPSRAVGAALASALGVKTGPGATGALTAARHAYEASELLRAYRLIRLAEADHSAALKRLEEFSRVSPGMALEVRTMRRRLDRHYPGWREPDCGPEVANGNEGHQIRKL